MLLGYNTNGFAHHRFEDAIAILADIGYQSIALTIDHGLLNPYQRGLPAEIDRVRSLLNRYQVRSVIETGARFLLDPRHKHEPTLMTADPAETIAPCRVLPARHRYRRGTQKRLRISVVGRTTPRPAAG